MKINYIKDITLSKNLIVNPVFETDKNVVFETLNLPAELFQGKKNTHHIAEYDNKLVLFLGIGATPDYKTIKHIYRRAFHHHKKLFKNTATLIFPDDFHKEWIQAAINGLALGSYQLGHFKSEKEKNLLFDDDFELKILSHSDVQVQAEKGLKIAKAQLAVFHWVDLPPNEITPEFFALEAERTGKQYGFTTEIFDRQRAETEGLYAFLSVGKGSSREQRFIIMNYEPESYTKHIGLVGKGITFDTGGLNIKTQGMVYMKSDMAGGAAVLGTMQLIADLKLPVKVTAIIPACENAIGNQSYYPGDVIKSYSGHNIEIIDTDAEGRLILADGLSYLIKNYIPDAVIDIATLTGSSVATFGYECGALFTNNKELSQQLQKSGDFMGERLWELPLWDAYTPDIESEIADVKNYSGKPVAGAISAAKFLEFFTEKHTAWAHLDIAGVSFIDDEFAKTKHASGYGVHLLTDFIENF